MVKQKSNVILQITKIDADIDEDELKIEVTKYK